MIATIAFGMGIDCQDFCRIIHWGFPSCVEECVQETGRLAVMEVMQWQYCKKASKGIMPRKE